MNFITVILILINIFIVLWIIITYNSLISLNHQVKQAFSGIDVQLKRRTDLIPNLIETVKGYTKHERTILENLTKARTSIIQGQNQEDIKKMSRGENRLKDTLKSLFAVSENYPDLKANKNFLKLQEQLSETEDQIAASRRIYNSNAKYLNIKIQSFPSNLIAKPFKFKEAEFFETNEIIK